MRTLFIIVIILTGATAFPQKSFNSVLNGLSFRNDTVSLQNVSKCKDFLANMKSKKNFFLPKPHNVCCDFIIFYIKSVDNISVFGIIADYEIENYSNNQILGSTELILYDSASNNCYLIEYEGMRSLSTHKINTSKIVASCSVNKFICRVIALDKNLIPYSSITFPSHYVDNNEFIRINYLITDKVCRKKSENFNFKPNEITYQDILNFLNEPINNSESIFCDNTDNFAIFNFCKN